MENFIFVQCIENISHKLRNKNINPKKYWSLLKLIVNGKKTPWIPLTYCNYKFVFDIKKKYDLFNSYFAEQCVTLVNTSELPSVFIAYTMSLLESFNFSADHIGGIIKKLDPKKAHEDGMISTIFWKYVGTPYGNCCKSFLKTA